MEPGDDYFPGDFTELMGKSRLMTPEQFRRYIHTVPRDENGNICDPWQEAMGLP